MLWTESRQYNTLKAVLIDELAWIEYANHISCIKDVLVLPESIIRAKACRLNMYLGFSFL